MSMNVSLTPKLTDYVKRKVQSGNYNSASEVMREALRLMQERDEIQRLRVAWDEGMASGDFQPYDASTTKQNLRKKLQAKA